MTSIPLSILELAVVSQGENAADAIERSVKIARHVEKLGYKRVWLAEHHNMEHIASSATSVLIGHLAGKTSTIRVGSGGIMLPNHAPLVIAEQFGTLETLYPGRIDLGLGRAPGTDQLTAMALRRNNMATAYDFPEDIKSLQTFFSASNRNSKVRAFPGEGLDIPIWILGSSTDSAYLAAKMGLPYAFAAHFAPAQFRTAIEIYRSNFQPSAQLDKPYVLACVNIFGAETDDEAEFLVTSLYRMFLGIVTNERVPLQPPGNLPSTFYLPEVQDMLQRMTACTFTGSEDSLRKKLSVFIAETGVDELMAVSYIYDMDKRLRSYEILKESMIV
ncbi:MAG: LLM class flavin-dependent oxidoreductase [Saprospiraceae bacterium]|jgi:luciferase family oxidoreductase group 1|uniref:LLM class flavin-dependent oxidoreductase n=1 Tax=Candidatus Brachybacter algidus TaxID=2982024 RepID=UPI001B6F0906|nr:LLM class flavin-dependent oxidoreductase [Candidatus Brachybacter algidus]MBP7305426.1 LLM class flavin-dependent oxidoreductase [Saprospiraceae bacterium]MBK6449527.1 LLM class flavin-dependent oxidoreductase [Candidatus Brachybacter algidus]MBK7604583.1 LLM class flavin-dependent oxidoreductase [Candidatus Brachybacter algidus]MBK8355241.1 LLM class flavin-dependent oxidoreductase [Candidatus Brachybacter algidus]MBK8604044.1 LLM class flavin-dependent oxidoreductase [Candidatus Brachyba